MFVGFLIFMAVFAANLFAPENIVSVAVGILATMGVTQFLKNWTGFGGFGATMLALIISGVIGIITVLIQTAFSGDFTVQAFISNAAAIFTAATVAYRAIQTTISEA